MAVLRSVKQLKRSTLDLQYKLTVRSIIDYCMPVYFGNWRVTEINRLEQIQYRAAKLDYSSTDCTCFFDRVASFKNSL